MDASPKTTRHWALRVALACRVELGNIPIFLGSIGRFRGGYLSSRTFTRA
jgi:hypothetical protein